LETTWTFENFEKTIKTIETKDKPDRIEGDTIFVAPKLKDPTDVGLGTLLDAMCVRLLRLGVELSYELDAEGKLTKFTFDQKVGHKVQRSEVGGFDPGNNTWKYSIRRKSGGAAKRKKDNEGTGGDFEHFRKIKSENGMEVEWKWIKISQ